MASKELIFKDFSGGADRDRTDDLLNAIQALSQLSYSPKVIKITYIYSDLQHFDFSKSYSGSRWNAQKINLENPKVFLSTKKKYGRLRGIS